MGRLPAPPVAASIRQCFPHGVREHPDVVASQVHMLPTERREMGKQMVWDILCSAEGGDGAFQIPRIPQDDCGDEQVEAGGAVLLVFVGAVTDFAEPMDEDRACQAVAGFALVQLLAGLAAQLGSLIQSSVNSVRSSRPSSRSARQPRFAADRPRADA